MYVLIYFLSVSLSQYISNITMDVTTDNEENFNYSRQDSLLLIGLFIVAIILQAVNNLIINYAIWVMLTYLLVSVSITLTLTTLRKQRIEKTREEITQIYEILHNLVDKKGKGVDFNNVPFTLEHKYNTINKIDVIVDPITFDDKYLPEYLNQLNNFLSTYTWNYELHLEERKISFVGYDKPPTVARWKGNWLRPTRFFTLGITGKGEIAWMPDKVDKKKLGKSQFLDEMGNPLQADMELPAAPQGLICGATGGGKSVAVQNIIYGGIAHRNEVALSLIDPKFTEFSGYKGMKGVTGVANTVEEAVEVLRIAKQAMYRRNQRLAELKIKNIMEYKPTKKSGKVYITGRDYLENDIIKVKVNSVEKEITVGELVELVNTETTSKIEVCLNGADWIEVNYNCVNYIYSDEMKMLVTIVDELAELTQLSGSKDQKSKDQDMLRTEIVSLIASITQLGRSAAIHAIVCTQKPSAVILPTVIRSNPLALDTLVVTDSGDKLLRDITLNDKVFGTDNKFHNILDITPTHTPKTVYRITFTNGDVTCSDVHQWTVQNKDNTYEYVTETEDLFINQNWYIENDIRFGRYEDNIRLVRVSKVPAVDCACITTNSSDSQFLIYTDRRNPIYTHNCGFRGFCGRANETGASMVALDNNLATTIDSTYPGMGIVQSGGKNEFIRYYFSKFEDLEDYYKKRGLDELGYSPLDADYTGADAVVEDLEGEIEINVSRDKTEFEFEEDRVEIDNRDDQKWGEV